MKNLVLLLMTMAVLLIGCGENPTAPVDEPLGNTKVGSPAQSLTEFENVLERVRTELKIPGFSAAITKHRRIVWAKGFGYANREKGARAIPQTVYHLASLTKPFAAVLVLQLVEQGKVNLDDPISNYGVDIGSQGIIRVRHLLSHTSEGIPGSYYQYNGDRFSKLDSVISRASGKMFGALLKEVILVPLQMDLTAPNPLSPLAGWRNDQVLERWAQGYTSNGQNPQPYPTYFGTAAGLLSTVIDMSKFSIALDNDLLLRPETKELMFAPTVSMSGVELPYGLGWFVDNNESVTIIWHYGYWDAASTLIMKIPERELCFVIMANSDRLSSASYGIGTDEDVNRSVIAQEFLNAFVYGKAELPDQAIY